MHDHIIDRSIDALLVLAIFGAKALVAVGAFQAI